MLHTIVRAFAARLRSRPLGGSPTANDMDSNTENSNLKDQTENTGRSRRRGLPFSRI
jgi:hypothetical protein